MIFNSSKRKLFIVIFIIAPALPAYAWQTLYTDPETRSGATFPFPIKAQCTTANNALYFGAGIPGAKGYSISRLGNDDIFKSCVTEKIMVDTIKDQSNPLYDAAIDRMVAFDNTNLLIVTASEPNTLYCLNQSGAKSEIFTLKNCSDAAGLPINGITALASNGKDCAFAAIKGREKTDDGIAIITFIEKENKIDLTDADLEKVSKEAERLKDNQEEFQQLQKSIETDDKGKKTRKTITKTFCQIGTKAAQLSTQSAAIKIGGDLERAQIIDMHWHDGVERLYVALHVQAGSNDTDGACALAVGRIAEANGEKKLILEPIINPKFIEADNHIVAGRGSNAQVSLHKITSMRTANTGYLDYLIVLGGNGAPCDTKRSVYALPLLNFRDNDGKVAAEKAPLHGTLANISAIPVDGVNLKTRYHFAGRHHESIPASMNDIYSNQSSASLIGGGQIYAGPIEDIFVKADAVYAVVMHPDQGYASGIYRSQALFDGFGRIAGWTLWQKAADVDDIAYATIDGKHGKMLVMAQKDADQNSALMRSTWNANGNPKINSLLSTVNEAFNKENGGIHELIEWGPFTPGLRSDSSFLCVIGKSKIMLFQSDTEQSQIFDNEDIKQLGPLTAAEIIMDSKQSWLVVGGVHGLALLCDEDGAGWPLPEGMGSLSTFEGKQFKRFGDCQFVRKLIYDDGFLYVLTDQFLDRIDMNASDFEHTHIDSTRLASAKDFGESKYTIFYDVIISDKCALLAHNAGLYRVGNGKDARIDDEYTLDWQQIILPDTKAPVTQLLPITTSGRSQDFARSDYSQVFVVTGSIAKRTGQIYRFAVENTNEKNITDATIMPVAFASSSRISYGANLASFCSSFATDGTLFITGIDSKKSRSALLINGLSGKELIPFDATNAKHISTIMRSNTYGNWLVAGDFGLQVNG